MKQKDPPKFGGSFFKSVKSIVFDVNVELIVGDLDSVFIECLLDRLKKIEVNGPEIIALDPNSGHDIDAACTVLGYAHKGLVVLESELVSIANIGYDLLCLVKIVIITDGEGKINTANILYGIVNDRACGERAVGNIYDLVVTRADSCVGDVDVLNNTAVSRGLDEIIDSEGACNENKYSARDIGDGTVNGETEADTEGSDKSGKAACIDSEVADKADHYDYFENHSSNVKKCGYESFVEMLFASKQLFLEPAGNDGDDAEGDEHNYQGNDDLDTRVRGPAYDAVKNCLPIHSFSS